MLHCIVAKRCRVNGSDSRKREQFDISSTPPAACFQVAQQQQIREMHAQLRAVANHTGYDTPLELPTLEFAATGADAGWAAVVPGAGVPAAHARRGNARQRLRA
jgi:hypothetical protein